MDPGEGDASLDNSCLVGGSSLEEVGLCGKTVSSFTARKPPVVREVQGG